MIAKLIIHGGAGNLEGNMFSFKDYDRALKKTLEKTYDVLTQKDSRAAVLYGIRMMENNPLFNAGTGSKIQKDGQIRMSAAIMSSSDNKFSAVVNIKNVKNPIEVANLLKEENYRILGGNEATEYARLHHFKYYNPTTEHRLKEYKNALVGETGTVGIVALDKDGVLCVGTSTGGVGYELPGRIGDSATVAGTYVSKYCGVSCTGKGEHIVNQAVAAKIVARVEDGARLKEASESLINEANHYGYKFGFIALDGKGEAFVGKTDNIDVLYAYHNGKKMNTFMS